MSESGSEGQEFIVTPPNEAERSAYDLTNFEIGKIVLGASTFDAPRSPQGHISEEDHKRTFDAAKPRIAVVNTEAFRSVDRCRCGKEIPSESREIASTSNPDGFTHDKKPVHRIDRDKGTNTFGIPGSSEAVLGVTLHAKDLHALQFPDMHPNGPNEKVRTELQDMIALSQGEKVKPTEQPPEWVAIGEDYTVPIPAGLGDKEREALLEEYRKEIAALENEENKKE